MWVFGGQEKKRVRGKVIKILTVKVKKPYGKQTEKKKKLAGLVRLGGKK